MASTDDKIPEPGDLIEIFRIGYQHWAIYIGDGLVIDFSTTFIQLTSTLPFIFIVDCAPDGSCTQGGLLSEEAKVQKHKLSDVVGKDKYRINNRLDDKYDVLPISLIMERTMALLGKRFPYSMATSNCEHFVTQMRYGYPESCQVHNAVVGSSFLKFFGAKTSVPCSEAQKKK
ncbi:phospholipase A and acyltransferase 3-like [Misgurnus anguillicaudatus]|uniref:phospholipase A and acyltransferase 3-like n=1 Tax=Misgurnus anguillicaudatus TaxID=75329 RepID=UPI003CCF2293